MKLKELFLRALYPEDVVCCVCGKEAVLNELGACKGCSDKLKAAPRFTMGKVIDGAAAGLMYNDASADMIHRFKYSNCRYLGKNLAASMEIPGEWEGNVIIPVPLHPARLVQRGYNQSLILAAALGERYGIPVRNDLLKRIRNTVMQALTSRQERRENVRNAFKAAKECSGLKVILVDDVVTTGSTAEECAIALKAAGAQKVYVTAACYAGGREN